MKRIILILCAMAVTAMAYCQTPVKKVYDETIDPNLQISEAVEKASSEGKYVVCQVGGNWCKWCLRLAAFIENDVEVKDMVDNNFVYIHVNYNPRNPSEASKGGVDEMLSRLGNPGRFGYPALVVLGNKGEVLHIQDSSFLESGEGYDKKKVMRFFKNWTPAAVGK
ncbi:MAG: thioredoxin family protein [Muribaculaceae bacterium]|nr:thioredoxin family protein [Muribaculaceae bacterium]